MNEEQDDERLLRAFSARGDESAFAELIRRHGRVVRTAVVNVTGSTNLADDISQATFLALARKASSLDGRKDSLAGWLYRVATRLACNARRDELRRKAREEDASMFETNESADTSATLGEAALAVLSEELGNLAEKYRQPVLLHHLEGLSYEAASSMCGCNEKTFSMRLTRGREKLRERLTRRGVTLGSAALIAALGQSASAAELPAGFVASTCAAAGGGAVSAQVSVLLESALKMLFWAKVKTVAAICAVAVLVGGVGVGAAITLPVVLHEETTTAPKDELLSDGDAWIRELLARAEAAPWDALDLEHATIHGGKEMWRGDLRGEPAGRRIWQTDAGAGTAILFDAAEWKRGVLTGRAMILPKGELPAALAVPADASVPSWRVTAGPPETLGTPPELACTALKYRPGPGQVDRYGMAGIVGPPAEGPGVWYRFALYFNTQVPRESVARVLNGVWREDQAAPPAGDWLWLRKEDFEGINQRPASPCLVTRRGVSALWEGLKFVPLDEDMPAPPPGVGKEIK